MLILMGLRVEPRVPGTATFGILEGFAVDEKTVVVVEVDGVGGTVGC